MINAAIKIVNVTKRFADQVVLDGINLEIPKGKITVILGRSGIGKSVLLKHMIGLLRPDRGNVFVDGVDIWTLDPEGLNHLRGRFGMLFQGAALFDSLNVFENVAFPLVEHTDFSKEEIERVVEEKLAVVGLKGVGGKMPSELSGGMRKRVGLARAIAREPEIILYDEPTTGLDPVMSDSVDKLILRTQRELNITSVVISHDISSAFKIGDNLAMIEEGRVIAEGNPDTFKKSNHPLVKRFLAGEADDNLI